MRSSTRESSGAGWRGPERVRAEPARPTTKEEVVGTRIVDGYVLAEELHAAVEDEMRVRIPRTRFDAIVVDEAQDLQEPY